MTFRKSVLMGRRGRQFVSRNEAGNRLQGVRLAGSDDTYTLCGHASHEALSAASGDQHVQGIQGMLISAELVHGHLFGQVQTLDFPDLRLLRLVD